MKETLKIFKKYNSELTIPIEKLEDYSKLIKIHREVLQKEHDTEIRKNNIEKMFKMLKSV